MRPYQAVAIEGGAVYRLSVQARCDRVGNEGRLQIIWLADRGPGRPDVRTFACTSDLRSYSREVLAPADAKVAVVYATGHTSDDILVTGVSLRAAPLRRTAWPLARWMPLVVSPFAVRLRLMTTDPGERD